MKLCKIVGKCWATIKDEQLTGCKLLIARELKSDGELLEDLIVAIDDLGAGEGDTVLITEGNSVIHSYQGIKPVDAVIIAIVERYSIFDN